MKTSTGYGNGLDRMYIDGAWVSAGDGATIDVVDPATGTTVGTVPNATDGDLDAALAAAERGFREWSSTDAWARSAALRAVARLIGAWEDQIAATMTAEQGKPLRESLGEVRSAAEYFDWFADEARRVYGRVVDTRPANERVVVLRHPVGPVAAFTSWNFPIILPARKLAAALAAGCSIVLKPAEEAPLTALWLAKACHEARIPAGVVNVVTGDPIAISTRLLESDVVRKVSLTGSVPVGRTLLRQAAAGVKAVSMELGGHAPALVFADADLEDTVRLTVAAKFRNAGQVCIAPSRFFVARTVYDEFVDRFAAAAMALKVGPGTDPATDIGPVANQRRLEVTQQLVDDAVAKGATVRAGGEPGDGLFYPPTVLVDVDPTMDIMTEEPFCPVAPIAPFDTTEEALQLANSTPFGLAGYLFTRDLATAWTVAERLEAGIVGVNNLAVARPEAPFGGVKHSGFGREGGAEGIDDYTTTQYVNLRLVGSDV